MKDKHKLTTSGYLYSYTPESIGVSLVNFWKDHCDWSQKTFGMDNEKNHLPALHKLVDEVKETIESPYDKTEFADCLILLFDAFRRSGGTLEEFIEAAQTKLNINKTRTWGTPDHRGVVRHIKTS